MWNARVPAPIARSEKSRNFGNFRKLGTRTRQFITVFHALSKEQTGLLADFVSPSLFFVSVHRSLPHRHFSFTHAQTRPVSRRTESCSPAGWECKPKTASLCNDVAVFLVLAHKRTSCFMHVHTLQALACTILLHGRAHATGTRVSQSGRHSLVTQDVIGVCHIQTYVNKKV